MWRTVVERNVDVRRTELLDAVASSRLVVNKQGDTKDPDSRFHSRVVFRVNQVVTETSYACVVHIRQVAGSCNYSIT